MVKFSSTKSTARALRPLNGNANKKPIDLQDTDFVLNSVCMTMIINVIAQKNIQ